MVGIGRQTSAREVLEVSGGRTWYQLRRTGTVQRGSQDPHVFQFRTLPRVSKEQTPSTHVPSPHELGREAQLPSEDREQHIDIFRGRDAAEKHHLADGADLSSEGSSRALQWTTVAGIPGPDVAVRESP